MASKSDVQDKLDFTGPLFDPVFALQNTKQALQSLPCKNAKTFNNLDEYHKKTFVRNVNNPKEEPVGEPERKFTQQQIDACSKPSKFKWKDPPDIVSKMDKSTGPLSLLKNCLGQRVRLSIRRRKFGPQLSQCEEVFGQLVAFDRHLNLILLDVDRVINIKRKGGTIEKRERHTNQLFLRGDNIIYVAKC